MVVCREKKSQGRQERGRRTFGLGKKLKFRLFSGFCDLALHRDIYRCLHVVIKKSYRYELDLKGRGHDY